MGTKPDRWSGEEGLFLMGTKADRWSGEEGDSYTK